MIRCPDWLAARFGPDDALRFDDFVEACLYDRKHGYYARSGERIGGDGDFVTGSTLDPAFAASVARVFEEVAERLPDRPLAFVEAGAGTGRFHRAFREAVPGRLRVRTSTFAVERSDAAREELQRRVPDAGAVADPSELPSGLFGVLFSYELYDALPFARLLGAEEGPPVEEVVRLDRSTGSISTGTAPARPELLAHLAEIGVEPEPGQELDVALGAAPMHAALLGRFEAGLSLAFDYGAPTRALYSAASRFHGTATAHRHHRAHRGLLECPGEQDLTAHVDFGELERAGRRSGWERLGLLSQARFLIGSGLLAGLPEDPAARRKALRLIEPEGMGEELRVLVESKGISSPRSLRFLAENPVQRAEIEPSDP